MAQPLPARARALLEAPNFAHVATIGREGQPYVTATWVDVDGDHIVLNSAEGRIWPRLLRRDPRVTLSIFDQQNPYEHVQIQGRMVEETHEGALEHINRMAQKYLGQERYPYLQEGEQRVIFRIEPDRLLGPAAHEE